MVLLHGWPLSGFTFHKLIPFLRERYDCIVPDLPGSGNTVWDEQTDFSIEGRSATTREFIRGLGIDDYLLLGQDTGATLGRHVAFRDHERVRGLILLNTEMPGHRPPWIPLYQRVLGLPWTERVFRFLLRQEWFTRSALGFGGCFHDLSLMDATFQEHVIRRLIDCPRALNAQIRTLRGIDWRVVDRLGDVHRQISSPTILIWGEDDATFPISHARRMVNDFGAAELVAVARSKLLLHEERPEAVAQAIMHFEDRIGGDEWGKP